MTSSQPQTGDTRAESANVRSANRVSGGLPRWLVIAGGLALAVIALSFGYYTVFARMLSLDEGYLMITVRSFLEGHALYDPVFTQYGPAYYLYQWFARGLLHIPITHDATRWLCAFHWLAAAAVLGVAGWRLTNSKFCGLLAFAQSVVHLSELANEPGHPQELVVLLMALGVLVATRARAGGRPVQWLALLAAGLVFTKINVGVFFGLAVALTLFWESSARWASAIKIPATLFCLGLPFLLMRRHLELDWCRSYGAVVAVALGGTCLAAWRRSGTAKLTLREFFLAAAFFVVPAVVFVGFAVVTGSPARALLDGLIRIPLQMPALVLMPLSISNLAVLNALVALATALFVFWRPVSPHVITVLKLIYGVVSAFVLIGQPTPQLAVLLPWVWLAVLPPRRENDGAVQPPFARFFLCFAAGAEALQAYPVAGTQIANGTILLVVTGAVCLHDALRGLVIPESVKISFAKLRPATTTCLQTLGVLVLIYFFANVWCDLPGARRNYAASTPLHLPGSTLVRMQPQATALFEDLSAYLRRESDGFISYPCLNSLYFWTEQRPPTLLNGTGWLQFDHAQQKQILDALLAKNRPRLVLPTTLVQGWSQQAPLQLQPLIECVTQQCEPVARLGPYTIFAPKVVHQAAR